MAEYIVTDSELTRVANAIRLKSRTHDNLEWPDSFVNAIYSISGGGSLILNGLEEPTSDLGVDGDIYIKFFLQTKDNSALGWYANVGTICKNTNSMGTINGRNYYKTVNTSAVVAFCRTDGGWWQPHLASTDPDAVTLRADSGGPWTYTHSYTIDGQLWYFNSGNHGWQSPSINTEYPVFEDQIYNFTTESNAKEFIDRLGVTDDADEHQYVELVYCKVDGTWVNIIGVDKNDINLY